MIALAAETEGTVTAAPTVEIAVTTLRISPPPTSTRPSLAPWETVIAAMISSPAFLPEVSTRTPSTVIISIVGGGDEGDGGAVGCPGEYHEHELGFVGRNLLPELTNHLGGTCRRRWEELPVCVAIARLCDHKRCLHS